MADLTEGQVGKLLIRKSGKVQLLLGKVTLDVTMGTTCSFLQVRESCGPGRGFGKYSQLEAVRGTLGSQD